LHKPNQIFADFEEIRREIAAETDKGIFTQNYPKLKNKGRKFKKKSQKIQAHLNSIPPLFEKK
jgi:hypothetical protein